MVGVDSSGPSAGGGTERGYLGGFTPEVELGWMLLPEHRGVGYATEAALALRPLEGTRVISLIRTDNPASEAVARRLGATQERVLEYWGYETGVWVS